MALRRAVGQWCGGRGTCDGGAGAGGGGGTLALLESRRDP